MPGLFRGEANEGIPAGHKGSTPFELGRELEPHPEKGRDAQDRCEEFRAVCARDHGNFTARLRIYEHRCPLA